MKQGYFFSFGLLGLGPFVSGEKRVSSSWWRLKNRAECRRGSQHSIGGVEGRQWRLGVVGNALSEGSVKGITKPNNQKKEMGRLKTRGKIGLHPDFPFALATGHHSCDSGTFCSCHRRSRKTLHTSRKHSAGVLFRTAISWFTAITMLLITKANTPNYTNN